MRQHRYTVMKMQVAVVRAGRTPAMMVESTQRATPTKETTTPTASPRDTVFPRTLSIPTRIIGDKEERSEAETVVVKRSDDTHSERLSVHSTAFSRVIIIGRSK